jgi:hypothetical protein
VSDEQWGLRGIRCALPSPEQSWCQRPLHHDGPCSWDEVSALAARVAELERVCVYESDGRVYCALCRQGHAPVGEPIPHEEFCVLSVAAPPPALATGAGPLPRLVGKGPAAADLTDETPDA